MDKIKGSGDDVKTINMLKPKMSKQITRLKLLLDDNSEIRATNFHGTSKTGKRYMCFDGFFAILLFNWSTFLYPLWKGGLIWCMASLKQLSYLLYRGQKDIIFIL